MESIMGQIERMEAEAERIVHDASRQARDIVKSVDEACVAQERATLKEIRDDAQKQLDERRRGVQGEIKLLEVKRAAEREELLRDARKRVPMAADLIFERIVKNGAR